MTLEVQLFLDLSSSFVFYSLPKILFFSRPKSKVEFVVTSVTNGNGSSHIREYINKLLTYFTRND